MRCRVRSRAEGHWYQVGINPGAVDSHGACPVSGWPVDTSKLSSASDWHSQSPTSLISRYFVEGKCVSLPAWQQEGTETVEANSGQAYYLRRGAFILVRSRSPMLVRVNRGDSLTLQHTTRGTSPPQNRVFPSEIPSWCIGRGESSCE